MIAPSRPRVRRRAAAGVSIAIGLLLVIATCSKDDASEPGTPATEAAGAMDDGPAPSPDPPDTEDTNPMEEVLEPTSGDDSDAPDPGEPFSTTPDPGTTSTDPDPGPPALSCEGTTPEGLAGCPETARIRADVEWMATQPRAPGDPHWQATQDRCAERLESLGFTVERHRGDGAVNVIGRREGTTLPDEVVIVGAHYDSVPRCEGADDNASGVAGALETARVLAQTSHDRTLIVACWDREEDGLVGSRAWAKMQASVGLKVHAYFNLEMIGFIDEAPNTQRMPEGFALLFPNTGQRLAARDHRADFIAVIADEASAVPLAAMERYAAGATLVLEAITVPSLLLDSPLLGDLQRSDHAAFWQRGYPGLFITDTADFRYSGYHCGPGGDVPERLDFDFARKVVQAIVGATAEVLDSATPYVGSSP